MMFLNEQKVGYVGGAYMNGYYAHPQPQSLPLPLPLPQPQYYHHHHMYSGGRVMVGASPMMPLYTVYPNHQSHAIGFPQPPYMKPISGIVRHFILTIYLDKYKYYFIKTRNNVLLEKGIVDCRMCYST